MDNRFDDVYTLLTYFIGVGRAGIGATSNGPDSGNKTYKNYANSDVYVQRHDFEGKKIARQAREWASKVLRQEDLEVGFISTHLLTLPSAHCVHQNIILQQLTLIRYTPTASYWSTHA